MSQSFDDSDRLMPPEFQTVIDRLRERGLVARFRRWVMGDSIFVGHERRIHRGGIEGFGRVIYIGQRDNGTWYTFDLIAGEEDIDESEIVRYVERRLMATEEEYQGETRRRAERNCGLDP